MFLWKAHSNQKLIATKQTNVILEGASCSLFIANWLVLPLQNNHYSLDCLLVRTINLSMEITLTTPAMLFPAVSLLLLAYTNRFVALASIIRNFEESEKDESVNQQISNLRKRIQYIKKMQESGVGSFFFCVVSMLAMYLEYQQIGNWVFGFSLVLLLYSLWLSVKEIRISVEALDVHLAKYKEK